MDFNTLVESFFDGSRDALLREVLKKKDIDKKVADINRAVECDGHSMKDLSRFVGKIAYKLGSKFSSLWLPTCDVFPDMTADEIYLLDAIRNSSVINVSGLDAELVDYVCSICGRIERGGLWVVEQSGRAIVRIISRAIVRVKRGLKYNSLDAMEQWERDALAYKYDEDAWDIGCRMFEEITADSVDVVVRNSLDKWGSDVRGRVRKSRLMLKTREMIVPLRETIADMLVDERTTSNEVRDLLVDILEESSEKKVKDKLYRWFRLRDYIL